MLFKLAIVLINLMCTLVVVVSAHQEFGFAFDGFRSNNLVSLSGEAIFTSNGLIKLTNSTNQHGLAFYTKKVNFKNNNYSSNSSTRSSVSSFSTTFAFAIVPQFPTVSAHGILFLIAPAKAFPKSQPYGYFGVFNAINSGNATNHVFAVELDTFTNQQLGDTDDNHVGIDINGLNSSTSHPAGYFDDISGEFHNLTLFNGKVMQVWVEYSSSKKQINVTLAPSKIGKPKKPLLSLSYDLHPIINEEMYVGFSSTTGVAITSHYLLGWSFMVNGMAKELHVSKLPKLPRTGPKKKSIFLTIGLPLILVVMMSLTISGIAYYVWRKKKFAEVLEDWELEYGPHRFKYKDLYVATKGFNVNEILGAGGFGRVYKGVLRKTDIEVAVKRVSHESRQGMREFIAEIGSIGRLRHRNVVQLLGYCRRKGELLLVYDYMHNGSLDRFIHNNPKTRLNWMQKFHVIKGVAAGLKYLHQDWEQVVIHRDIKASNVLLDSELNGRLGDFGLARLYDHGSDSQTTHVVGTIGYLAPEHTRTGKATTSTDVFSFGAFLLDVVCGRRPVEVEENLLLVDYVFALWQQGEIIRAVDQNLGVDFVAEEVELVLKLGLLCSSFEANARPSMEQVVQYLNGSEHLPELSSIVISSADFPFRNEKSFSDYGSATSISTEKPYSQPSSVADSFLSGGR